MLRNLEARNFLLIEDPVGVVSKVVVESTKSTSPADLDPILIAWERSARLYGEERVTMARCSSFDSLKRAFPRLKWEAAQIEHL